MTAHANINYEKLLYRILLGYYYIYIDNTKYKIKYPCLNIKYEAELLYDSILENNKFDKTWLTDNEIDLYLIMNKIWYKDKDKQLEKLQKQLEKSKISLFLNFINKEKKQFYKKEIDKLKDGINQLGLIKNSYSWLGVKDYALSIKNEFIIMNSIYDSNNNLVFNNPEQDSYEHRKLQDFIREIVAQSITLEDIRNLAKSDVWRSYSSTCSIQKDILLTNDDYKHLISLHNMYDNARQHPEAPNKEVMEDDDALEGWFLYQNEKMEKEKKKNAVLERIGGNIKDTEEVFILTQDRDETEAIFALNDEDIRSNIRQMNSLANKSNKSIDWQDVPFVKRQIQKDAEDKLLRK